MSSALVYGQDARLLPWACKRIGINSFRSDAHAIGLERRGLVVAVVVYDNFSSHDCNMHVASDGSSRWLTRSFLMAAFAHPFLQWGLRRVSSPISESNTEALRFNEHLGFKREGYHPNAASDGAVISLGLLKEDCAYLPRQPIVINKEQK